MPAASAKWQPSYCADDCACHNRFDVQGPRCACKMYLIGEGCMFCEKPAVAPKAVKEVKDVTRESLRAEANERLDRVRDEKIKELREEARRAATSPTTLPAQQTRKRKCRAPIGPQCTENVRRKDQKVVQCDRRAVEGPYCAQHAKRKQFVAAGVDDMEQFPDALNEEADDLPFTDGPDPSPEIRALLAMEDVE